MAAVSAVSVSCLKGGSYESTYPAYISFEEFNESYVGDEFYDGDGVYFKTYFYGNQDLLFNSARDETESDYSGFAISIALSEGTYAGSRYAVNAKEAATGDVFTVFHEAPWMKEDDFHHIHFLSYANGTCAPVSCMVNNTKQVAEGIAEYNGSHEKPLTVTLKATGYAGGAETGSAEIMLAGERDQEDASETSSRDTVVSTWTSFDLSKLGNVEYIDFSMTFSDETQTSVEKYFCMDDFWANIHISM